MHKNIKALQWSVKCQQAASNFKLLASLSKELNEAEKRLRLSVNQLSGTDLSDWSLEDVCEWVALGCRVHKCL